MNNRTSVYRRINIFAIYVSPEKELQQYIFISSVILLKNRTIMFIAICGMPELLAL